MKSNQLTLLGKTCGVGLPPLIIAELSGNHGGKRENALHMIEAAAKAGADAVKIQTYRPDTITIDHGGPEFCLKSGLWQGRTLYELYEEAHTPWEWHEALFTHAKKCGIPLLSSPFDNTAVDLLESLECPAYKIASFELIDIGLIRRVAASGKPIILSTGMATLDEIDEAVEAIQQTSTSPFVLLHCTSAYPAAISEADLRTLPMLADRYGVPVGLSDHTLGSSVAVASVALGACVIEKHFTMSRGDGAIDAGFSMEPGEFSAMATGCRQAWQALGQSRNGPAKSEVEQRNFRRSLYAVRDIPAGKILDSDDVRSVRPGLGLHPRELPTLMGSRAKAFIAKGTAISWKMVDTEE